MNRTTVTIVLIVILSIAGLAAWYFLKPLSVPTNPNGNTGNGLPNIGGRDGVGGNITTNPPPGFSQGTNGLGALAASLQQIINKPMLAPTLSADGKFLFYVLRENGHIMKSSLEGKDEQSITNLTVLETFDGAWSPKKTKLTLWYAEGNAAKAFLQETATSNPSRILPTGITSAVWSPDGASIAYLLPQGARTNLIIADANNRSPRTIYSTPIPDFTLQWPERRTILLVSKPSGLAPSLLISVNPDTRVSNTLMHGVHGIVTIPVPDGSGFLFSKSGEDGKPTALARYIFKDASISELNTITIADKCVFSPNSKKLYCGVPQGIIPSPSPDVWYQGGTSFSDTIVEIDLATNQLTTLTDTSIADIDALSLFVTMDQKYLYFVDKKTSTLWRLTLKE